MKVIWTELAKYKLKEAFQYYKEVAGIKVANSIKEKIYEKPGSSPVIQRSGRKRTIQLL